jgi:DNA topoisomerase-1
MSSSLIIVESPAKCKKIEQYLGTGYKCIASFGHIRELDGLKSINIKDNFKPTFIESASKSNQIAKIRALITNAKEVLLASDDDREGEAIAWHICQVFGLNVEKTKRIIFHEVTESALKKAVANPTLINMNIVNAQIARQVLDVLVGYKLSPLLWKYIKPPTGVVVDTKHLSAGRCQTPALRLVYENQKEIESSPGSKIYNTTGYFTSKNLPFVLTAMQQQDSITEFLEASVNHSHIYTCGGLRNTIKKSPLPFTTSTIQQTASNDLHISPKETMKICQKLYEEGYITYMRTDSMTYSLEFLEKTTGYISVKYGSEYNKSVSPDSSIVKKGDKKLKKPAKVKEEVSIEIANSDKESAHEAIRPTNIKIDASVLDTNEFTSKEIKMYDLIWKHTLESCMSDATYKAFTAVVSAPQLNEEASEYRYCVEKVVFPGWKIVRGDDEENAEAFTYLQTLKSGSILPYKKITAKETISGLKAHYTEARLVQLLEQQGIGRPSTFSSLIDKIQDREYVKKSDIKGLKMKCLDYELEGEELSEIESEREIGNEKNKLVIQPTGLLVIEFLLKYCEPLFKYAYTKQMEDSLDLIAKGLKTWHELCADCLIQIEALTILMKENPDIMKEKEEKGEEKIEIKIDEEHTYIIAKYGPVIKYTPLATKGRGKGIVKKFVPATFKAIRHDIQIDLDKLRNGGYTLSELLATEESQKEKFAEAQGEPLGKYKEKNIYIKKGKYGPYIECGEIRKSIKGEEIALSEAIKLLDQESDKPAKASTIVRKITEEMSVRAGQYGDYIFYKKAAMKTPKFFKLTDDFEHDYKKCDVTLLKKWIKETYGV